MRTKEKHRAAENGRLRPAPFGTAPPGPSRTSRPGPRHAADVAASLPRAAPRWAGFLHKSSRSVRKPRDSVPEPDSAATPVLCAETRGPPGRAWVASPAHSGWSGPPHFADADTEPQPQEGGPQGRVGTPVPAAAGALSTAHARHSTFPQGCRPRPAGRPVKTQRAPWSRQAPPPTDAREGTARSWVPGPRAPRAKGWAPAANGDRPAGRRGPRPAARRPGPVAPAPGAGRARGAASWSWTLLALKRLQTRRTDLHVSPSRT